MAVVASGRPKSLSASAGLAQQKPLL